MNGFLKSTTTSKLRQLLAGYWYVTPSQTQMAPGASGQSTIRNFTSQSLIHCESVGLQALKTG